MARTTYASSRTVRQLPALPRSRTPLAIVSAVGLCLAVHSCAGLKSSDAAGAAETVLVRDQGPLAPTPAAMLAKADASGKAKNDGVPRMKPKVRPEPLKTSDEPLDQAAASLQSLYSQLDQAQAAAAGEPGTTTARVGKASSAMSQRAGIDVPDDASSDASTATYKGIKSQAKPSASTLKRPAAHAIVPKNSRPPLPMELGAQSDEVATTSSVQAVAQSLETVAKVVPAPTPSTASAVTRDVQQTPPPTLLSLGQVTTPKLTMSSALKPAEQAPTPSVSATPAAATREIASAAAAPAPAQPPATSVTASTAHDDLAKLAATASKRRADAIAELASQSKPDVSAIQRPLQAAMPLIALEALQTGAGAPELDKLSQALPRETAKTVNTVRQIVRELSSDSPTLADPKAFASMLREHADRLGGTLEPSTSLSLGAVALCKRVDSFGRYMPLASSTLTAGRISPVILYSEVQNFSQQPTPPTTSVDPDGGTWSVELSQELQLIFDADGSRQWTQPEGVVRDVSRSKRNDYYLVQRVELPKNLSVGRYTLKVIVRDKSSGSESESNVPIQIVADPGLTRADPYSPRAAR